MNENRLIEYYLGNGSDDERGEISRWIASDTDNRREFDQLVSIWDSSSQSAVLDQIDVESDWKKILEVSGSRGGTPVIPMKPKRFKWSAAAAIIISLGLLGLLAVNQGWFGSDGMQEFQALNEIETITLSDGTQVTLKQGSTLTFPEEFEGDQRLVELKGQAFFDVAKDENMPFHITSERINVEVLGTSFYVLDIEDHSHVDVVTGKVKVSNTDESSSVTLTAGKSTVLLKGAFKVSNNENKNVHAWRTGKLVFEQKSLDKIAAILSAHYDTKIEVKTDASETCTLTMEIDNDPIHDVLKTIQNICGCQIEETPEGFILR